MTAGNGHRNELASPRSPSTWDATALPQGACPRRAHSLEGKPRAATQWGGSVRSEGRAAAGGQGTRQGARPGLARCDASRGELKGGRSQAMKSLTEATLGP